MTDHLENEHAETWARETLESDDFKRWMAFLARIEELTGIDNLDGDRSAGNPNPDAYCLDELLEWFEAEQTPEMAQAVIAARIEMGCTVRSDHGH